MNDKEYAALMLLGAPGFGAKSVHYIYSNLKKSGLNIHDLFELQPEQFAQYFPEIGRGKFSRADVSVLKTLDNDTNYDAYQKLKEDNIHIISLADERYPQNVMERLGENAPPILFCKGYLPLLHSESISIVGSREISETAIMQTEKIANRLANNGYNIVSGFAKGVDTTAHIAALKSQGTTSIVLSYGFEHLTIKPELKNYDWEKNCLFISQFMPYEKFSGSNAMIRNKLVCTLSKAVIVISSEPERDVEGKMSGTFDSGKTALKHKIPLFVLSPDFFEKPPRGNADLIELGGMALSNTGEILEYFNQQKLMTLEPADSSVQKEEEAHSEIQLSKEDAIKNKILEICSEKPLSIHQINEQANLNWSVSKLTNYLKKLEEIEIVKNGRSNFYKKRGVEIQTKLFS